MHAPSLLVYDAAERVFSVLISSTFRKNGLGRMGLEECRPAILAALGRRTRHGSPVQLTVLAFPFKVPNPAKVGSRKLPDFAEFAAIRHLRVLRDAIEEVYPPGLEIHILHDGSMIGDVFGIDPIEVHQYETYFDKLVNMAGAFHFIRRHDFCTLQRRSGLDPNGTIDQLRSAAEHWCKLRRGTPEWRLAFQKTLGMINLREFPAGLVASLMRHARMGQLPRDYAHLERRVRVAMVQYHVNDAIIHQFDPRPQCFPDAIHATTQDRRGRLSIWMVRRGQSRLPWHGIGCIDHRGRAQVLCAADIIRRGNYHPMCVAGEETPFVYHHVTGVTKIPSETLSVDVRTRDS